MLCVRRGSWYLQSMSKIEDIDISGISFSSTVCPTAEDRAIWASLSDAQRHAILLRDEEKAFESGLAEKTSKQELLDEVRRETRR